jgi:hypothetical protein
MDMTALKKHKEITMFISIENEEQKLVKTNYWESEYAKNGYCFITINAGWYRLLVPRYREDWLGDIKSANSVIISRGPAPRFQPPKSDAFEILFEDNTQSPFSITTSPEQWDRVPP